MNQEINPKLAELLDKYDKTMRDVLHEFHEYGFLTNPGCVFVTSFGEVEIRGKENTDFSESDTIKLFKATVENWLQTIFENEPSLQNAYEEKVIEQNLVHYDDVDGIAEKAWELFLDQYEWKDGYEQ